MLSSVLFLVTIYTRIPFKLNFSTTLNFIQNIMIIRISHNNRMYLYEFFSWILLQIFSGVSWTYIIVITSRRGWIIVRVGTMIFCCSGCCFQYQLVFSCMEQRYCALTTNSPAEITCPSIVVLFCISQYQWSVRDISFAGITTYL